MICQSGWYLVRRTEATWMTSTRILLLCLSLSCLAAASIAQDKTLQADASLAFVDAHVHLNKPEMQLQLIDEYNLPKVIAFWGRESDNDALIEAAKAHPNHFIPFVSISPERRTYRGYWQNEDTSLLDLLEGYLQTGVFKGVGEISVTHFPSRGFPEADFSPLGPIMTGIMQLAARYNVPVNIHCEVTRITEFSELLETFPNVNVIWAHGGYTPYFLAKRMLAKHPNLTYELSARTYTNHPRSPDYTIFRNASEVWPRWLELIELNPGRFVVGTDASHRQLETERRKVERVQLLLQQLTPETRRLVAIENMLRLVGG